MSPRSPFYLATLALLLLGVVVYLSLTQVAASGAQFEYPGSGGDPMVVRGPDPKPGAEPPAAGELAPAPALNVLVDLKPVARLYPDETAARGIRVQLGQAMFAARAECIAGPLAGPSRGGVRGQSLARITLPGGDVLVRGIAEGEDAQSGLAVQLAPPVSFDGVIVDAVGLPLSGAEIDCDGRFVSSDGEGRFHIDLKYGGAAVPLVARMPGKSDTFRLLDLMQAPREPVRVVAAEGGEVRIKVVGPARPGRGEVVVLPGREQDTRLMQYPFWRQADVRPELSSEGTAVIKGLPRGACVRFRLRHDALLAPDTEDLRVGEKDEAVLLQAAAAPMLSGRILTQKGAPIAGATITSRRGDADPPSAQAGWILPGVAQLAGAAWAISAADGSYAVARWHATTRESLVRITAPGFLGIEVQVSDAVADLKREFRLPAPEAAQGQPVLVLNLPSRGRRYSCALQVRGKRSDKFLGDDRDPLEIPLKEPCLLDVYVEIGGPAGWKKSWPALAATGRTPLPIGDH